MGGQRVIECGLGNDKDDEKYETEWYEWFPELALEVKLPDPPQELTPSFYNYTTKEETNL